MKNNMNDNNLDNSLDQYFEKARKIQTDFSVDDAAAIIERSNQSASNNVKPSKGVKPMNIIISAAAIVAAGWLATTIDFNSDEADSRQVSENVTTANQITQSVDEGNYLGELVSPEIESPQKATNNDARGSITNDNDIAETAQLSHKKDEDPINRVEYSAKADTEKYALATEVKSKIKQKKKSKASIRGWS